MSRAATMPRPSVVGWRRWSPARRNAVVAVAALLGAVAFLYRFNALGGSLGGFDNDHFIFFVRARQLLLGEQPLRDFADAGLQGAWPSLTYELSAWAQRWLDASLLGEALLACTAIAASIVVTFVVGARLASMWGALLTATMTLFLSTKLYNYPRALVFAIGSVLLTLFAVRRNRGTVMALGAWIAVAFLFRHDFAVYFAVATLVAVLAADGAGAWSQAAGQLALCAVVAGVLLLPSAWWVQRYEGIGSYVRTNIELGERETQRTSLRWPTFSTAGLSARTLLDDEGNATAWLYYLLWTLPAIGVALFGLQRWKTPGAASPDVVVGLSLSVLALVLDYFFLRGNLVGRFGDLGAPVAVTAAMLLGRAARVRAFRLPVYLVVIVIVGATIQSVFTVGNVSRELDTSGLSDSVGKVGRRLHQVRSELHVLPDYGGAAAGVTDASLYLRRCVQPADRVLTLLKTPEVVALAPRPFAGRQPTFNPGFYDSPYEQQRTLARLSAQRVPVVVAPAGQAYQDMIVRPFPMVATYVAQHYAPAGELAAGDGPAQIWVSRSLSPVRTDMATGFPCFR